MPAYKRCAVLAAALLLVLHLGIASARPLATAQDKDKEPAAKEPAAKEPAAKDKEPAASTECPAGIVAGLERLGKEESYQKHVAKSCSGDTTACGTECRCFVQRDSSFQMLDALRRNRKRSEVEALTPSCTAAAQRVLVEPAVPQRFQDLWASAKCADVVKPGTLKC